MEIKSINRLQFRHHSEVFTGATLEEAREFAINYIKDDMWYNPEYQDNNYGHSLFSEPTVIRYSIEGEESNPHVIFVIGAATNETNKPENNKFCIIDIDKTEQEIEDLWDALEKVIKSLTIIALSSDTLNLYAEKTDDGTYISGDVKTSETHVFDDVVKYNNMMVTPDGLFIYADVIHDEENDTYKFVVSKADGTLKEVKIPNNHLVEGRYDKTDESIHLLMKEGDDVVIDCEDLIAEWTVEGEASTTPIVLTREEVDYDPSDDHQHVEKWQDILRADVRIYDEDDNILKKVSEGTELYVGGKAQNIAYYKNNGDRSTVKEQLDRIKLNPDNDNIIFEDSNGFFSSVKLDYVTAENKLVFTKSTVNGESDIKEIKLNSLEFLDDITYDPDREVIVIRYIDAEGNYKTVEIPAKGIIEEWEVDNENHNISLDRIRVSAGTDTLSADAKIHNGDSNILEDKDHTLYVRGEADNIKYGDNSNVEAEIDALKAVDEQQNGRLDAIDADIGDGFGPRNTVRDEIDNLQDEIDAISADSSSRLSDVINEDESIGVETRNDEAGNPTVKVVKVNLSQEQEEPGNNIIRLEPDGIYAGVDLEYYFDSGTSKNVLVFKTTNGTKTFDLKTNSVVDKIYYDPAKEAIIIEYTVNGHRMPDVVVPVGDLINEWRVEDGHPNAVQLEKIRESGATQDVLKASVVITSGHDDNILVMDDGSLYVSGAQISANTAAIEQEIADRIADVNEEETRATAIEESLDSRLTTAESDIDILQDGLREEISARTLSDESIGRRIDQEIEDREAENLALYNKINTDVLAEKTRAESAETALQTAIANEFNRASSAETALQTAIDNEANIARSSESALQTAIGNEETRAESEEGRLAHLIEDVSGLTISETIRAKEAESGLTTLINAESERASIKEGELDDEIAALNDKDTELSDRISGETFARQNADTTLQTNIEAERTRAMSAETELRTSIENEISRSTGRDSELSDAITAETQARQDAINDVNDRIDAATHTYSATTTARMNKSAENVVTTEVIIPTDNNIIINDEGVKAFVSLNYDSATNTLVLEKTSASGRTYDTVTLNAGSLIDSITYDSATKELVITWHSTDEPQTARETRVNVESLFNPIIVNNLASGSSVELSISKGTGPLGEDELSAKVLLTNLEDNAVKIVNNGLYVSSSAMTDAKEIAECVENELGVLEKVVIGHPIGEECGSGYKYEPNNLAAYISTATSFNNADLLLDRAIDNLSSYTEAIEEKIEELSGGTDCLESKTNSLRTVLGINEFVDCSTSYVPDSDRHYIVDAQSFKEADNALDQAIYELANTWFALGSDTPTANLKFELQDQIKKGLVTVRLSHGTSAYTKSEEEKETENVISVVDDEYFSNTNVLKYVDVTIGRAGEPLSPNNDYNGLYLSNIWDCSSLDDPNDYDGTPETPNYGN